MGGIFWGSIVTLVDSITSGKCFLQNSGRHQRHRTDLKKGFHWHKDNFSFSMRSDNKEQRYPRFVQAPHSPLCKPSCQTCTWLRPLVCTRIFKLLHRLETFEQLHLNPALVIAARTMRKKILQSILLTISYPSNQTQIQIAICWEAMKLGLTAVLLGCLSSPKLEFQLTCSVGCQLTHFIRSKIVTSEMHVAP